MNRLTALAGCAQAVLDSIRQRLNFIGPLLLRLYLAPVFWVAGNNKWNPFDENSSLESVIEWFGNPDWGLGLPFPALNAYLAWGAEYFGAILLALGLATRWICIPLMFTMLVAMVTVHISHGWQAVHDLNSPFPAAEAGAAIERLDKAKSLLREHGNYNWLTEHGNLIVANNGIEWAATYLVMLCALFFLGGGRYLSVDYWLRRRYKPGAP
ncbi:MAG: DoxX family protein [Gammaproteobacteria bacterium]|nr:DoxX family protein [Gammaproteobacteria bacterium]